MRPENEHDMVLWKHISRGRGGNRRFQGVVRPLLRPALQVRGLLVPRPHLCRGDCIGHLYAHLAACRGTPVRAYLFRAVRNRALNRLRDERTGGIPIGKGSEPLFTNPEALQLEADEMLLLIAEVVSQLPDRCREVFRKSREEGLSNAAIANQMRISVKTVEAQITKALRRIRETLLRT